MTKFHNFHELEDWLQNRGMFHMRLGLERMRQCLADLNFRLDGAKTIQVLGTNGKGSTCVFLAALASGRHYRAGLYTSPHFVSFRERILVDGVMASEAELLCGANEIFSACPVAGDLTYFEFLTCLAVWIFRKARVDVMIFEAGLGGINDATTAIQADIRCFTPIAMDHAAIIGPGIREIAKDKASAISEGSSNFSAPQFPLVRKILREAADEKNASLTFVSSPLAQKSRLKGEYQAINSALALAAWQSFDPGAGIQDLRTAFIPGRLQEVAHDGKTFILDGAHNPHAMQGLIATLEQENIRPASVIFSCLADKDWQTNLSLLHSFSGSIPFYFATLDNPRAAPADLADRHFAKINSRGFAYCGPLQDCLKLARSPTLITGSLFLLAEFYTLFPMTLK